MNRTIFVIFSCLFLFVGLLAQQGRALKTEISPREVFRITESVAPMSSVEFFFTLIQGQTMDLRVVDEKNNDIKVWENAHEGNIRVDALDVPRFFSVFFDNRASLLKSKKVTFHLYKYINKQHRIDVSELDPIEAGVETMSKTVDAMFKYQMSLRDHQNNHRSTVEDSNVRILLWATFQILTLLVMSFSQIYFLKRFLERRTFI